MEESTAIRLSGIGLFTIAVFAMVSVIAETDGFSPSPHAMDVIRLTAGALMAAAAILIGMLHFLYPLAIASTVGLKVYQVTTYSLHDKDLIVLVASLFFLALTMTEPYREKGKAIVFAGFLGGALLGWAMSFLIA